MAYHVIYREPDGWMWQSYEGDTPDLPPGYSCPEGFAVKSFDAPPEPGKVWHAPTLDFIPAPNPGGIRAALLEFFGADRVNDELLAMFPLALPALDAGNWPVFRHLMDRARSENVISSDEYAAIDALLDAQGV